ncbi:hypothetical protein SCLCIDRAFT_1207934 [Scleroderma citrinum Foug A]|uniref:Uncharacterized protein n=1 Tax=Scleroderma citrinum Foug A TaxID=1036808 RepID=A0A0C3A742_9AGAM|nr:hypothetical protein SCLCIDRAFT_1207934 [Scleroderma citrinum Foug A]
MSRTTLSVSAARNSHGVCDSSADIPDVRCDINSYMSPKIVSQVSWRSEGLKNVEQVLRACPY